MNSLVFLEKRIPIKIQQFWLILLSVFFAVPLVAQNGAPSVQLLQSPDQYSILYMSDLIEDPAHAPNIFQIRIVPSPVAPTPKISLAVSLWADIPDLDIQNAQLFAIRTEPFILKGAVTLTNRDLTTFSNQILTENGENITLRATRENIESLPASQRESLLNKILTLTAVPAGVYRFRYSISSEDGAFLSPVSDELSFEFEPPTNIQLITPGDHTNVQTINPIFYWQSTGAAAGAQSAAGTQRYQYGIRISEYDPSHHGSPAEALEDDANVPFPDDGGFLRLQAVSSFQYPFTAAKQLEIGKQYVWQVRKYFQTSHGEETIDSEIYTFTVGGQQVDPLRSALESILGTQRYNQYFGIGGPLAGYSVLPETIRLNGRPLSTSDLMKLASEFDAGTHQVQRTQVDE